MNEEVLKSSIYLPVSLHEALRTLAYQQKTVMAELIRKAIKEFLERQKDA